MAMKLNVGVSRKIGLPKYSSAGASINLELELPQDLLERAPAEFRARVHAAYSAAHQAVRDELERLRMPQDGEPAEEIGIGDGCDAGGIHAPERPRPGRPATPRQLGAIRALARRNHVDVGDLLQEYQVARAEDLSAVQASRLIDTLRAVATL